MAPSQRRSSAEGPSDVEMEDRKNVKINKETVADTFSNDYPNHYPGEDHSWDLDLFRRTLDIKFYQNKDLDSQFSLIGTDASIANAFRRIMIAELPTLAIEQVFMYNNTSVIQDEVLAHRLGLIPFKGGKKGIRDFLRWWKEPTSTGDEDFSTTYDYNTIQFRLNIECTRNKEAAVDESDPLKLYHNAHVYAKDIEFVLNGNQKHYFSGEDAIEPVNPDILIAKMRPGQLIECDMYARKGVGSDHAKFSPVSTASYRLMPQITITKPIIGADAEKFAKCFPSGVIGLEKITKAEAKKAGSGYEGHEGELKAVVKDPMRDTVSRECLRHPEFEGKVKLGRRRDHFIFSVESSGQWDSDDLFMCSVAHLKKKCRKLRTQLKDMPR